MRIQICQIVFFIALPLLGSCDLHRPLPDHRLRHLSETDIRACVAEGGYEDWGGFGEVFCQFRYSDGGKICSGKRDCQGRCLVELGGSGLQSKVGDHALGQCQAVLQTFGCSQTVEGGKIVADNGCDD